jgi:hypothetical protein
MRITAWSLLCTLLACGSQPVSTPAPRQKVPTPHAAQKGDTAASPLKGHALLAPGTRLNTSPEGSAASFELEVDERGALFTIVGEREGWVELRSWFPPGLAAQGKLPPACVPLARGLEVVDLAFFVRSEAIDAATVSEQDPRERFGCQAPQEHNEDTSEVAVPELQGGRPRVRLPMGRGTTLTEHELARGVALEWPDGKHAGKVRLTHRYADAPTLRNGRHCVLGTAGLASRAQLSWCTDGAAFEIKTYEQQPIRRVRNPASDRSRTLDILREMGLEMSDIEANAVYDSLSQEPELLDDLFRAQEEGQLAGLLPPGTINSN